MNARHWRFGGLAAVLLLLAPIVASAHAIVLEATPDVDATVGGPDVAVIIRFNSRIDHRRSRLTVLPTKGAPRVLAIEAGSNPALLAGRAEGLPPGAYTLRWQVLAEDGHITRGDIPFKVGGR